MRLLIMTVAVMIIILGFVLFVNNEESDMHLNKKYSEANTATPMLKLVQKW